MSNQIRLIDMNGKTARLFQTRELDWTGGGEGTQSHTPFTRYNRLDNRFHRVKRGISLYTVHRDYQVTVLNRFTSLPSCAVFQVAACTSERLMNIFEWRRTVVNCAPLRHQRRSVLLYAEPDVTAAANKYSLYKGGAWPLKGFGAGRELADPCNQRLDGRTVTGLYPRSGRTDWRHAVRLWSRHPMSPGRSRAEER